MRHAINHRICSVWLLLVMASMADRAAVVRAQPAWNENPVLNAYIREGLRSNQALQQKRLDHASDLAALKEVRGLFFPDVSLNARYTVADGGRIIEFPVGDLLNPVYSTLNVLTGSDQFPQVANEEFPFLRPTEHETKLSLVQPIFSSDVIRNYQIRKQQTEISRIDTERYSRELVKEISKAYFGYQKAHQLVWLADSSISLVRENLRVSQSLFENDKVTIDEVYRSESELSRVEVQQAQAKNMLEASKAYFNFLLNRELDAPIELFETEPEPLVLSVEMASREALQNREEIRQLEEYRIMNRHITDLYRGNNVPGLYGLVDYGFQGEEYRFTGDDDFVMASLVMKWNLFQGTVNRHKVQQSKIEGDKLTERLGETKQQIRLEVINHYYASQAAYESVQAAGKQTRSARRAYELIRRKYSEGQSTLLELMDARTSLTNAAANMIIARSEYYSRLADLKCATSAFHPENYQLP